MEKGESNVKNSAAISLVIPSATVFTSSFCIMVLELVAARLIAKHLGSSLYTWTAVIGVVLAGISLGNYLGGRIADRFQARKALAVLFATSSATCALTVILNNLVGQWSLLWQFSWPARVFSHVFLVFMLPSTLLGMVGPVVAKMALDKGLPTGKTVGDIYAWGAVGSIAGTFAAGYWLIEAMGTIAILWAVGGILLLMSILFCASLWLFCIWAVLFLCTMAIGMSPMDWCRAAGVALALREQPDPRVIYHDETPYCYISVQRRPYEPDTRAFLQDKLVHSKIVMGDITNLQYFYTKIYAAITQGLSAGKEKLSVMVIGGGGYVYPRYVEKMWPGSAIEVVEIDPGVTKAAMQAFGLERNTTIKTITMDARNYVDQLLQLQHRTGKGKLYEFIYEDAVNDYSVPYQLVTKEFNDKIASLLTDDGVYMTTLIDIYDCGRFLGAIINTLQQTFPAVYVTTDARMPTWARNTFVVVAAKRELDLPNTVSRYRENLRLWCLNSSGMSELKEKSGGIVLTDYYAPVENLLAPVVRQSVKEVLASEYFDRAERLAKLGKLEESIDCFRKATQARPQLTIEVYNRIGLICTQQEDYVRGVEAFKKAIEYYEQTKVGPNIGSVRFNLGLALRRLGREKEAVEQLLKVVDDFRTGLQDRPNSPELHEGLGSALLVLAEFDAAAKAFERAAELNPDDLANYLNLAKALELQGLHDQAVSILQRAIDYMQHKERSKDAAQLRRYLEILAPEKSTSSQKDK
jgi:predicted membrane-bound spermidine synthase/lipoprotein NlpI